MRNKLRPKKQYGGPEEEDNKFNVTPANLRRQPSYGFIGPTQPNYLNYGPVGPKPYAPSASGSDCPEGMIWDESLQQCTYDNGYNPEQENEKNKPTGRGPKSPAKTGPGTGVNPNTATPTKPAENKFDPYFLLRGATTGMSWLGSLVERNRQNQYATQQYSTLGQLDPVPVSNFQPTPYNLYAQKGGYQMPRNLTDNLIRNNHIIQDKPVDKYPSEGEQLWNVTTSLPALGWEKLDVDMPAWIYSKLARLGEKIGLVPNKELFPGDDGKSKMTPAQYELYKLDQLQEERWKKIKKGEYKKGGMKKHMLRGKHQSKRMMKDMDKDECSMCDDMDMDEMKKGGLTPNKARKILHDKSVNGHPLTDKQRRFFGAMSKGNTMKYKEGGFMGINPEHKGWCTPLNNPKCTGARRRLALTLKKHHGFHE